MKTGRTIFFLATFFGLLILLSVAGVLFNVFGAVLGTAFAIVGLLLKLMFSKSVLTLMVIGFIAYIVLNRVDRNHRSPHYCDREY